MGRWITFAAMLALTLLLLFGIASMSGMELEDPAPLLRGVAVAGVLLLVADVVLPVPSSLVMAAHGALFGTAAGALLSILGSTLAALTGFALGRAGNDVIRRFVTPAEHDRAGAMLRRWGVLAIVLSRPVPILAETVAILAGSSPLTWRQTALAAAAGSLAPSVVYAWAGAHANGAASHALIFGGVLAVTGVLWYVGRASARRADGRAEARPTSTT
ncbi:MAG TPA: VTT domain-containing protein [Thermoanaerobaculia bacterium]